MTALATIDLVLASTSRYRRELLARLAPKFETLAPAVDETPHSGEHPRAIAIRLALAKAHAVAARRPDALIVGSDQVAAIDDCTLGKPGSPAAACEQLAACSGRAVDFHTAVCLLDTRTANTREFVASDLTRVVFRPLHDEEIERYVSIEAPLDCAGSFKAEGLGIALFERIESEDPTALIGLPLIALARLLRDAGIILP